ncbi:xanthine dehydrogenase family protein molybdopterin-binding subunit [Bosea sp. NPDC055594]
MSGVSEEDGMKVVGKRVARVDGGERVTGRAIYSGDLKRPGMVVGKILRSPHAHARILGIDTSRARALKGVLAVITAKDLADLKPGTLYPNADSFADAWVSARTVIARDKVLWRGHAVAAVAAVDEYNARAALQLIEVEYAPLPALIDIETATASGSKPIVAEHAPKGFDTDCPAPRNAGSRTVIARGDTTAAFAEAAIVAEISVAVDTAHHGYLEPHACVAESDADGRLTVWVSTQGVFATEMQLAALLALPQSRIKVIPLEVGGAFGGKITVHVEPLAARLAQLTGRPVKIVTSREEVLQGGSGTGAAARIGVRLAADEAGSLSAIEGRYIVDAGGLPGTPTTLLMQSSAAPYQSANLDLQGWDILTNKPHTESYRGPGGIQAAFAMEQAIDELSLRLGLDPLELRRRNAAYTGTPMPLGMPFPSMPFPEVIACMASHACWREPIAPGSLPRGRGVALGYWRGTSMTSAAHVTIAGDGRPMVTMGAVDLSGTRTAMAQVAAEEFGYAADDVHVATGDSKSVGFTDIAAGSRIARTMTVAVSEACRDAIAQLRRRAAIKLQCKVEDVTYAATAFHSKIGGSIGIADLMRLTLSDGAVIGRGVSTRLPLGVEIGGHVCDVEVDPETGQVTILRYTAFQEVGRALNPTAIEGQIHGSIAQGAGWALTEHLDYAPDGRLRNASLLDYRMPTALDLPKIGVVILETPVPDVPYGVRGVAEMPIIPVAAAIGNAIRRAIGVRMTQMPMTPERVLAAIGNRRP